MSTKITFLPTILSKKFALLCDFLGLYFYLSYYTLAFSTFSFSDRPGEPQITAPSTNLTENTQATFTCVSSGGYPAPTFLWTMRGEAITESSYTASGDGGESRSEVVLSLTHNEDQQDLQCQVIHPLVNKSSSIQLNVLCK